MPSNQIEKEELNLSLMRNSSLSSSDSMDGSGGTAANSGTPRYKDSCVTSALESGALSAGINARGVLLLVRLVWTSTKRRAIAQCH